MKIDILSPRGYGDTLNNLWYTIKMRYHSVLPDRHLLELESNLAGNKIPSRWE